MIGWYSIPVYIHFSVILYDGFIWSFFRKGQFNCLMVILLHFSRQRRKTADILEYSVIFHYVALHHSDPDAVICSDYIYHVGLILLDKQ